MCQCLRDIINTAWHTHVNSRNTSRSGRFCFRVAHKVVSTQKVWCRQNQNKNSQDCGENVEMLFPRGQ